MFCFYSMDLYDMALYMPAFSSSSSSKFHFQKNITMEQYREKNFVDINKHIETLLHLSVVTREATGLIKLATKTLNNI